VNSLEKYAAKRLLIVKLGSLWGRITGAKQTGWGAAKSNQGQVVSNVGAWDQGVASYPRRGGEFKPIKPDPHLRPSLARHPGVQAAQPAVQPAAQPAQNRPITTVPPSGARMSPEDKAAFLKMVNEMGQTATR